MLSTVCVLMSFRLPCSVNELLHSSQVNRCSPLCVCWCAFRLPWCVKDLLHTSHINGCSPLCVCWCAFRLPCCVNDLSHTSQVNRCSPLCVCVDVPSDYCAVWMTYYTHWSYILASHQNNYSAPQMLYQIHDLNMDDPHHLWVPVLAK